MTTRVVPDEELERFESARQNITENEHLNPRMATKRKCLATNDSMNTSGLTEDPLNTPIEDPVSISGSTQERGDTQELSRMLDEFPITESNERLSGNTIDQTTSEQTQDQIIEIAPDTPIQTNGVLTPSQALKELKEKMIRWSAENVSEKMTEEMIEQVSNEMAEEMAEEEDEAMESELTQDQLIAKLAKDLTDRIADRIAEEEEKDRKALEEKESEDAERANRRRNSSITSLTANGVSLALPQVTRDHTTDEENRAEDVFPLAKEMKETAILYEQSLLKTVGPKYLYTVLPRQCEVSAYKYVKEDYNPPSDEIEDERESLDDTLITITIYDPTTASKKFQEIEILGSLPISSLRDTLYCMSDFSSYGYRLNNRSDGEVLNTLEKKLSPSLIYMDHIFYADVRSPHYNWDYYNTLIDHWLTKKGVDKRVFSYKKESMENLFENTSLILDKPAVFLHQDKCEHMIVIKSVRLIGKNEYTSKEEFPRTTFSLKYQRYKCSMCTIFPATKMTEEEIVSGFSPCYYCDPCFESFHNANRQVPFKEYRGTHAVGHFKKSSRK
ncbi:snRNA-activating protein of 50kDa MW C terminal-domain-containing protein [Pilaira anomala]|nr:snRNA-activating protein of 50kDa MW C terminal-domain-containing protein [Pilaira anomala]